VLQECYLETTIFVRRTKYAVFKLQSQIGNIFHPGTKRTNKHRELRYFYVYVLSSRQFKISLQNSKRSFYRAANSIFGKIGRIASENVIIQLVKGKCIFPPYYMASKHAR